MRRVQPTVAALICLSLFIFQGPAVAQPVTSAGWEAKSKGLTFYAEAPMIDNKQLEAYGIGRNITAEGVINAVRYVDAHPAIEHLVFTMDTGGGSLYHAEAMEDAIDLHRETTKYHVVVQNAISAGIWTAFSCDNIFICRDGVIGGATAYTSAGGRAIVVQEIPYIAAQLEITAKHNGHPHQVIRPLMHMQSELHVWTDDQGQAVLSNDAPDRSAKVTGHRKLDANNTVLTLTAANAIEVGVAKPIDAFDAALVGEQIGAEGWTRANRYGFVVDEIGYVYNQTRVLEDLWVQAKYELDTVPLTSFNRDNARVREMLENRRKFDAVLTALRQISDALNELPDVHPERHVYLEAEGGKTLLADPEQWEDDAREALMLTSKVNAGIRALSEAYEDLSVNPAPLREIIRPGRQIIARVGGIKSQGNVAYWQAEDEQK